MQLTNAEVLYSAINKGILLKDDLPELLTDKIEELSRCFLENEFLIKEKKRLQREELEEFCAD